MLLLLPESAARTSWPAGSTVVSTAIHASIIAAVVVATMRSQGVQVPDAEPRIERFITVEQPASPLPMQVESSASAEMSNALQPPALTVPSIQLPSDLTVTLPNTEYAPSLHLVALTPRGGALHGTASSSHAAASVTNGASQVLTAEQVDKAVLMRAGSTLPRYPELLRRAGVEGHVVIRFVVDTAGHPVLASLEILESDHQLFTSAVREAFVQFRFLPAEVNGRKVPQLVQLPFRFTTRESR